VSAAEGREGAGWLEYGWLGVSRRGLRSTEDGGEAGAKVQIGAELLCKGGKERVEYWIEYRVRITDFKGMR